MYNQNYFLFVVHCKNHRQPCTDRYYLEVREHWHFNYIINYVKKKLS